MGDVHAYWKENIPLSMFNYLSQILSLQQVLNQQTNKLKQGLHKMYMHTPLYNGHINITNISSSLHLQFFNTCYFLESRAWVMHIRNVAEEQLV